MPNLILVDSSFFVRLACQFRDPFDALEYHTADYDFATCGIVWLEVVRGRRDPNVRARFEEGFSAMPFLPLTPVAWQHAAGLAWTLDRQGSVLPATDLAIAACALEHDAAVLTFDRHFDRIPGLIVLDELR